MKLPNQLPSSYEVFLPFTASFLLLVSILLVSGTLAFLHLISRSVGPSHHPKEPHLIPQRIPYIGHVLGLVKNGLGYYLGIRHVHRKPASPTRC